MVIIDLICVRSYIGSHKKSLSLRNEDKYVFLKYLKALIFYKPVVTYFAKIYIFILLEYFANLWGCTNPLPLSILWGNIFFLIWYSHSFWYQRKKIQNIETYTSDFYIKNTFLELVVQKVFFLLQTNTSFLLI